MTSVEVTARPAGTMPAATTSRDAIGQAGEVRSARLESLRAVAALGVLFGHVYASVYPNAGDRYGTYLDRIALGGGFGVYLFFALSGYLLYRPFAKRDIGGGAAIDLRRYAINRAVRILPLYYAAVILMLLIVNHGGTLGQWLTFGTFTENFHDQAYLQRVDGVVWSLVVEVQFYVLLPLIALGIARVARGSMTRAAAVLLGAGLVSEGLQQILIKHQVSPTDQWRHSFLLCFMWFVPGMLLAVITAGGARMPAVLRGPVIGSSTSWLIVAAGLWMLVFYQYSLDIAVVGAAFVSVASCVLPLRPGVVTRALEWRWLAGIGVASYSLYLWHQPIVQRLPQVSWLPHDLGTMTVIAVPLCIAIAVASYGLVERPFLRMRRRWSTESAPIATSAAPASGAEVALGS